MAEESGKVIKLPGSASKPPPRPPGWKRFGGNDQFMARLATQIGRGDAILVAADLDPVKVRQWTGQTKVFLHDTLGLTHNYLYEFEMALIGKDRMSIEAACLLLKAVLEDAKNGYLKYAGD